MTNAEITDNYTVTLNNKSLNVTKRSGEVLPLNYEKIHRMVSWACEGLKDTSASQVVMSAHLQFYDKMPTKLIHDTLVQSAVNLITEETPDYQYVAARLLLVDLRKIAYNQYEPTSLLEHIQRCVKAKKYSSDLLTLYSENEINQIQKIVDQTRDLNFTYAGLKEFAESYLVKEKNIGLIFETPQYAYIALAMTIFSVEDVVGDLYETAEVKQTKRLKLIKELYDTLSLHKISLPTPIMANCRTPTKQFASCTLIDCGDSIDSIFTTAHAIGRYITRGAGIGLNMGRVRGDGSSTKNGLGYSTGCIPFYKLMESATNSCSQGGIRKGASTVFYPFWHKQVQDLVPLKDSRGSESSRIQHLDYSVQLSKLFYDRVREGGNLTLFCPSEVPDLYEAFFQDTAKFEELYVKYENKKSLKKESIKAKELLDLIIRVRSETGRLYIHNVDNSNEYGSFLPDRATVYQSNLCVAGDTKVTIRSSTGDVYIVDIKEIGSLRETLGDIEVLSYNLEGQHSEFKRITDFALMNEKAVILRVTDTLSKASILCTPEHPIYTLNRGYVKALELTAEDQIKQLDNILDNATGTKVESVNLEIPVYDITVEGNHNFFGNTLLVKNCTEILLPTKPLKHIDDEEGLIALCTLGAINLGKLKSISDMEALARILVRSLDNLLTYQEYPIKAAARFGKEYRSLGIGVSGLAHYLAKNGLKYAAEGTLELVHETFEAFQYYLLKASNELAKERGKCAAYDTTKYSQGSLTIDRYKTSVDSVANFPLKMDWKTLRAQIKEFGLRHTVLSSQPPIEKSSVLSNTTNGIEAPRAFLSVKNNKNSGSIPMVVPDFPKLKKYYQLAWDKDYSNKAYINIIAILQKFIDQSISANLYYNPETYYDKANGDHSAASKELYKSIITDIFGTHKLGIRTLYYHLTQDNSGESFKKKEHNSTLVVEEPVEEGCPDGVCAL